MEPQTFRALVEVLCKRYGVVRDQPHAVVFDVDGEPVELFRIRAGSEEWAALTIMGGRGARPRNPGMGAPIFCGDEWALRLVFPIAEVSADTFQKTMLRLSAETLALREAQAMARDPALFEIWSD